MAVQERSADRRIRKYYRITKKLKALEEKRGVERLHYHSPEVSKQRALEAMGSAREVGYAPARAHKPWLGWLWEASRLLLPVSA